MIPEILVRREAEAASLIADPLFRRQWRELCHRCPWATVFQDVPYVTRWYELYCERYEPMLVSGRDDVGDLTGLFCLGMDADRASSLPREYRTRSTQPGSLRPSPTNSTSRRPGSTGRAISWRQGGFRLPRSRNTSGLVGPGPEMEQVWRLAVFFTSHHGRGGREQD